MSGNGTVSVQRAVCEVRVDKLSRLISRSERGLLIYFWKRSGVCYTVDNIDYFCSELVRENAYDGSDIEWKR